MYKKDDIQEQFCYVIKGWLDVIPETDIVLEYDREDHEREMEERAEKLRKRSDKITKLLNEFKQNK